MHDHTSAQACVPRPSLARLSSASPARTPQRPAPSRRRARRRRSRAVPGRPSQGTAACLATAFRPRSDRSSSRTSRPSLTAGGTPSSARSARRSSSRRTSSRRATTSSPRGSCTAAPGDDDLARDAAHVLGQRSLARLVRADRGRHVHLHRRGVPRSVPILGRRHEEEGRRRPGRQQRPAGGLAAAQRAGRARRRRRAHDAAGGRRDRRERQGGQGGAEAGARPGPGGPGIEPRRSGAS